MARIACFESTAPDRAMGRVIGVFARAL